MIPYIFIFNKPIPMYGLCVVTGVLVASLFATLRCKRKNLCWEDIITIGVTGLGVGFVCAKLLYIFISFKPQELIDILKMKNFSIIIDGGFVFYGGLIGGVLGALLGAKIVGTDIMLYEDSLTLTLPLAHSFGRIGCLCAGCCYGKPAVKGFGVVYKTPLGDTPIGIPLMPIQIYEALYNIIIFIILLILDRKINKKHMLFAYYLLLYSAGRFVLEFFRYDYVRGIYFGLSTSQLISVLAALSGVIIICVHKKAKN